MKKARTFVISDIHGGFKALKFVLDEAMFDFENDKLICLGDVCDGWPEAKSVLSYLAKLKI